MSFRTTAILLLVLAVMGGYVYNYVLNQPPPPRIPRPFVYQFDMLDIVKMDVSYKDQSVNLVFDETEGEWNFVDSSRGKADSLRINGIRLLLSGPGANRLLVTSNPTPAQLVDYGLDMPEIVGRIVLKDGQEHTVNLGLKTPDGRNYYVKNSSSDQVYLVDYTWGDEIVRFVTEPPLAKEPVTNSG